MTASGKCCGCARLAKDEDMTPRSDAEAPHREQGGFVINGVGVLIRGPSVPGCFSCWPSFAARHFGANACELMMTWRRFSTYPQFAARVGIAAMMA
jgi:hypothetical protein